MKRKLLIFISILAMSLFVACGDDKGAGVAPLPNNPGVYLPDDGYNHNKIIWQSSNFEAVSSNDALAKLLHRIDSACWLTGWYFGRYNTPDGFQNCNTFDDGIEVAFAINKDNGRVELYIKAYYNNFIWAEYTRQTDPSNSCGNGGLCANFGPTYPTGQILDDEIGSEVRIYSPASGNISDFEQMESIEIKVTYDNRNVGTFFLERAN